MIFDESISFAVLPSLFSCIQCLLSNSNADVVWFLSFQSFRKWPWHAHEKLNKGMIWEEATLKFSLLIMMEGNTSLPFLSAFCPELNHSGTGREAFPTPEWTRSAFHSINDGTGDKRDLDWVNRRKTYLCHLLAEQAWISFFSSV